MYMPVDIVVRNRVTNAPISGALVKVFAEDGISVYGEMSTNASGVASFLLFGPKRYQMRCFKFATAFTNPLYFDVSTENSVSNVFTMYGSTVAAPSSTDPRMCMCSGFFRTATGAPAEGVQLHFYSKFNPLLLEGSLVTTDRIDVRTNKDGWAQVPLVRNGIYSVLLENPGDVSREVAIPDAASCNLPDLVFEVVDNVTIDPSSFTFSEGSSVEIVPQIFTSTGRQLLGTAKDAVRWEVDDPDVVTMTVQWDKLILYGYRKGTTTLRASRYTSPIVRIPDPAIHAGTLIQVV